MTIFSENFKIPEGIKVISFDVFDTLLIKPFEKQSDIYSFLSPYVSKMVGKKIDFKTLRVKAESETRQKLFPKEEVTIHEIYENFTEIPVKFRGAIKFLEIETELKICFKRKSAEIIYEKVVQTGLPIIAISDTYFEEDFISKLLQKNGLKCDYVFCSSSCKKTKKRGTIYPEILTKLGIIGTEMLHIGANLVSDAQKAREYGINIFYLPSLVTEFYKNPHYKRLFYNQEKCVLTSASIGLMCEKIDSSIRSLQNNSLFERNLYNLGFNAFGGIIFAFTNWVYEKALKADVKTLFFVARDGFVMHKMMQLLHPKAPFKCEYLEVSRRSIEALKINSRSDVIKVFSKGYRNTTIANFIKEKLECDPAKIASKIKEYGFKGMRQNVKHFIYLPSDRKRIKKVIEFYSDEILSRALKEKVSILKYLEKTGILNDEKVALCDVGYSGTTQKIFSLFKENIEGYYLITNWKAKSIKTFGFLGSGMPSFKFKRLKDAIRIMETVVFCAPSGTIKGYNKNGNPIFEDLEQFEEQRLEANSYVWKGMFDFAILLQNRIGIEALKMRCDKNSISKVFLDFALSPEPKDAKLLRDIVFENKSNAGGYRNLVSKNGWKVGFFSVKYPNIFKSVHTVTRKIISIFKLF